MAVHLDAKEWQPKTAVDSEVESFLHSLAMRYPEMVCLQADGGGAELTAGGGRAVVLTVGEPEQRLEEEGFGRLLDAVGSAHEQEAEAIILLVAGKMTAKQSCQAIVQGVTAMVHTEDEAWRDILEEQVRGVQLRNQRRESEGDMPEAMGLVGQSSSFRTVVAQAQRAARVSDAPVIITGESGTGKQRFAELIHRLDEKRGDGPFVCVNCAAIAGTLAESELFGHHKGAFTGATKDRHGYFRAANGGTILLDEISELSAALQPKILRVLQEGKVLPVGSDEEYPVDVRVIAATNRELEEMVEQGVFRLDLYQRLNVIHLRVPPLRARRDDIPVLFEAFVEKYAHYRAEPITAVDPQVYDILVELVGHGNVRELENIVRQILVFKEGGQRIGVADIPRELLAARRWSTIEQRQETEVPEGTIEALINGSMMLSDVVDEFERKILTRLLKRGVKQTMLADRLGITRRTLYNKLQKHRLR